MAHSVDRIKGDLRYNRIYRCCDCNIGVVGDTESTTMDTFGHEGVAEHFRCIELAALNPQRMPVGWVSSYGDEGTVYRCTNCKRTDKGVNRV